MHAAFASPVLLRVSKIALQLEAQSIRGDEEIMAQCSVTTAKHHMSGLVGVQMCFDDDDNRQHLGTLLLPERHLVYLSLALFLS